MELALRCENKLHGVMVDDEIIEISCSSRFCGAGSGIIVRHRISTRTGDVIETMKFKNPTKKGKG